MWMEIDHEYFIAWAIYLLAALVAQLISYVIVGWKVRDDRASRPKAIADFGMVVQLLVFAVLITPVRLELADNYWVPAFMAALMDGLNYGSDKALTRIWPIAIVLLLLLCISITYRFVKTCFKTNGRTSL
jgi:hypothetical protein